MEYVNIDNVSFQQMRICTTVAELGSFTDAANALYISQPTISKQISSLERTLGIVLFIRGKNTAVRPTPAGKILFEKWRDMFIDFTQTTLEAAQTQACLKRPIVLCTTPSANIDEILQPLLREHRERFPEDIVRVNLTSPENGVELILSGEADVMICNPYRKELYLSDELESDWLVRVPWSVGMLKSNPLAKRKTLAWSDLRQQKFIMPNSQPFITRLNDYCAQAGFHPKIAHITRFFSGLAINTQNDDECFLTDRYMADYGKPGYAYFDMPGRESGLILVSRRNELDVRVDRFLPEIADFCAKL